MDCNVVIDLIPLYIDGCCSEESKSVVEEHLKSCVDCKKILEDMKRPSDTVEVSIAPKTFSRINYWKASILQSVLLFLSFALVTIGVALEASTPSGLTNSFWAFNLVIPATGFMLSLANWYFLRVYKNRKVFSNCSMIATIAVTVCAYIWLGIHYEMHLLVWFSGNSFAKILEIMFTLFLHNAIGVFLAIAFCTFSKILSNQYAKMLGKE